MGTYKDLKVWQMNQVCIKDYLSIPKLMPTTFEFRHIFRQLFRSITSIGANIAEGHESDSNKEFARYLKISIGSAVETDHWLITLTNLLDKKVAEIEKLTALNLEVIKMLKGLKKSIESR